MGTVPELWFVEEQTKGFNVAWKTRGILHQEKSAYQHIAVVDLVQFGRALVLDGVIQTTAGDEFVYHEMIAHVPLVSHPCPRDVLVVGGGDGGAVREILRHPSVRRVELVEIDERVMDVCRNYLPETACSLEDERVAVHVADGVEYVAARKAAYDVIIVDSPDPTGPAVGLFQAPFYASLFSALREDGLFAAQGESPLYNRDVVRAMHRAISAFFPLAGLYLAVVPTYPGGMWGFAYGSKKYPLDRPDEGRAAALKTRYYSAAVHRAALVLPGCVGELLG